MFKKIASLLTIVLVAGLVAGCSSGAKTGPLSKIIIVPERGQVNIGQSLELNAKGYDAKGNVIAVNPSWRFQNTAVKIGTLNKTTGEKVTFTGKTYGTSTVLAEYKGVTAKATVEVIKSKPVRGK
jgi:hypothetical protein